MSTVAGLFGTSIGLRRATAARKQAEQSAARARQLAEDAQAAESATRLAERTALRQAYSASMLSASDVLEHGQIEPARHYLTGAPASLRGWEWRHSRGGFGLSYLSSTLPVQTSTGNLGSERRDQEAGAIRLLMSAATSWTSDVWSSDHSALPIPALSSGVRQRFLRGSADRAPMRTRWRSGRIGF
ncbi:MAG: hypothetical protein U1G07_19940 [Verrucomicrobiota bacterium]